MIKRIKNTMFKLKNNKLVFRNFVQMFVVCILVFVIVFASVYVFSLKYAQNNAITNNKKSLSKISELSDIIFKQMEYVSAGLAVNDRVKMFAASYERPYLPAERLVSLEEEMRNFLLTYKGAYEYVDSIYIYESKSGKIFDGSTVRNINDFYDTEWIGIINQNENSDFLYFPRKLNGLRPYYITFIKNMQLNSFILVNINVAEISDILNNSIIKDAHFTITGMDGVVYYSNNFDEFADKVILPDEGKIVVNKQTFFSSQKISNAFDWRYTLTEPSEEYDANLKFVRTIFLITLLFLIILSVVIAGILAVISGKPINELVDIFIERGYNDESDSDEMVYLAQRIIRIIDDNKYLRTELDTRLAMYNELQLISLQAQINPHFLNNALNSIIYVLKIKENRNEAVSSLITLSRLVGYSYVHDEILVSLKEELVFLNDYIHFLKIRYGDFKVIYNIDKEALEFKIPRLSFQTLVENAMFHGIGENTEKGILEISAKVEADGVFFEIKDNGKGIDNDKLEQIRNQVNNESFSKTSVGIKNVFRRFSLIFGDNAECTILSEEGKYTAVIIRISEI
jgi:two-component system sensor histidine kinase YesM